MNRQRSKAGLFLMEMILVIFFFSICAAICVNLFAGAKMTSEKSVQLNNAVVRSTNLAEIYKSADGDLGEAAEILEGLEDPAVAKIEVTIESVSLAQVPSSGSEDVHDRTTQVAVHYIDEMIVRLMEHEPGRSSISVWAEAPDGTSGEVYSIDIRAAVTTAKGGDAQ